MNFSDQKQMKNKGKLIRRAQWEPPNPSQVLITLCKRWHRTVLRDGSWWPAPRERDSEDVWWSYPWASYSLVVSTSEGGYIIVFCLPEASQWATMKAELEPSECPGESFKTDRHFLDKVSGVWFINYLLKYQQDSIKYEPQPTRYRGIHDNWTDEGTGRPVNS